MSEMKIRAKSVLKIEAGDVGLDYEFPSGTPFLSVVKSMTRLLVRDLGAEGARELINKYIATR